MSSENPQKPTPPSDSLRHLEALPASTAGRSNDLPGLPGRPEDPAPRSHWRWVWYAVGGVALLGLFWLVFGGPVIKPRIEETDDTEDGILTARKLLRQKNDQA